ncbi:hypothetical protein [Mycobacterium sp.]|uniref:hypothetical protein n=1 Tax=Mycobacterium sp. TaxID=1785 RepID=UPI0012173DC7|nr:hypothetical protein [Mycobacterium sp.]TAM69160.1 MAG: hypothetical protein EPN51_09765 [Mycobacterium sp.]
MSLPQMIDDSVKLVPNITGFHLVEPRCRVCSDDAVRKKVNDLLATGSSYAMILRALGDDKTAAGKTVTIDSVRNHAARHFPVQQVARATYREIVERRAREAQIDIVNGVATALTPMALYECIMNEAFSRLVNGDVDVSIDTGLRAAEKLQAMIDARAQGTDMSTIIADVGRIIEVIRTFIPSEKWPEVQAALQGDRSEQRQQLPSSPEDIRVVAISDNSDEDDY